MGMPDPVLHTEVQSHTEGYPIVEEQYLEATGSSTQDVMFEYGEGGHEQNSLRDALLQT